MSSSDSESTAETSSISSNQKFHVPGNEFNSEKQADNLEALTNELMDTKKELRDVRS